MASAGIAAEDVPFLGRGGALFVATGTLKSFQSPYYAASADRALSGFSRFRAALVRPLPATGARPSLAVRATSQDSEHPRRIP
jgi:hypothetical protein